MRHGCHPPRGAGHSLRIFLGVLTGFACAVYTVTDYDHSCIMHTPRQADADWQSICPEKAFRTKGSHRLCCSRSRMGRCGIACKELYNHPERKNSTCFALPPPLVERAFLLGQQGGALQRLQKRLACAKARRTHVKLSIVANHHQQSSASSLSIIHRQ